MSYEENLRLTPHLASPPAIGCDKKQFELAILPSTDFKGMDLSGMSFKFANLRGSSFVGANINGADFYGADLRECDFDPTPYYAVSARMRIGLAGGIGQRRSYQITVIETREYRTTAIVNADSKKEARAIALKMAEDGELDMDFDQSTNFEVT